VLASHKNLHTLIRNINNELIHVSSYLKANKLSLNINKTNFMLFKNKHDTRNFPSFNVEIDNVNIMRVTHTKFLGILLDDSLTWKKHTTYIANLVSKYSGILYRLKPILPSATLFTLYNSLVLPHLMYCNIVWGDSNNAMLGSVHIKQKKIIRICTNSHYLAHTPPLFADLNALTIQDIHKLQIAIFMYKFHNNMLPDIFNNYFVKTNEIHGYKTRYSNMYRPRNFNTNLANNTIQRQGPIIWSSISKCIRDSTKIVSFKAKFKGNLISYYE
jgi:hypothetical protein